MFTSYNFPKLENCIDKQLSQIGNISLVGDRALRSFLPRAPRLADPHQTSAKRFPVLESIGIVDAVVCSQS